MPDTQLDYIVDTIPAPLQTNTAGQIRVLVSNPNPETPVAVKQIALTFPVDTPSSGAQSSDLTDTGGFGSINPQFEVNSSVNTSMWTVTPIAPTTNDPQGTFQFKSRSDDGNSISGEGWIFILAGIPVNAVTGVVEITVVEKTTTPVPVSPTPLVAKDDTAHYIANMFLYEKGDQNQTPVTSVPPGTDVMMYWNATDNADYCVGFVPFSQVAQSDNSDSLAKISVGNCEPVSGTVKDGMLTGNADLGTATVPGLYVLTGKSTTAGGKHPSFRSSVPLWMDAPVISSFVADPASLFTGQQVQLSVDATNVTSVSIEAIGGTTQPALTPISVTDGSWSIDQSVTCVPASTVTGFQATATGPGGTTTAQASLTQTPTLSWQIQKGVANGGTAPQFTFPFPIAQNMVGLSGFQFSYGPNSSDHHMWEKIELSISTSVSGPSEAPDTQLTVNVQQILNNNKSPDHSLDPSDSYVDIVGFAAPANAPLWLQNFNYGSSARQVAGPDGLVIDAAGAVLEKFSVWTQDQHHDYVSSFDFRVYGPYTPIFGQPATTYPVILKDGSDSNAPEIDTLMTASVGTNKHSTYYGGSMGILATAKTGSGFGFSTQTFNNGSLPSGTTYEFEQDVRTCVLLIRAYNSGSSGDHHNLQKLWASVGGITATPNGKNVDCTGTVSAGWTNGENTWTGNLDVTCVALYK